MKIQHILATKGTRVVTIEPDATIQEAITTLVAHNIGALVVINDASKPIGIISERDIIRAAIKHHNLLSLAVRTLMVREIVTGMPDDDLEAVAHTMTEMRIRHVPVVEHEKLVGILSIGDIVKAQRDQYEGELYTLQAQMLAE
jgi:CBS domain-containing protein